MIIFLVLIFAVFYFLLIRPQRKRQKQQRELMEELKRGDKIITSGGIYGVIESVSEDSVIIKVESGATMRVAKSSVALKRDQQ
ncbi:MAG: preprotein translocase subunit YajC [Planctomycetes bacterium]|nr:preprotein translocase subunit YajC [Planctomycetota bacterium]